MDYFRRTRVKEIISGQKADQKVIILGWARTKRLSKNVGFIEINDGSSLHNAQLVFSPPGDFPELERIITGTSLRVVGKVVKVEGREQAYEVHAEELEIVGECSQDYPLQKKRHTFEFLREIAHLRPRTNTFGVINRFRSKLSHCIHEYYQQRGFYYIHTPIITTSDCEGAGDLFQVTTLPLKELAEKKTELDMDKDFFAEKAYLTVSGQLEGELMCTALGDIYTFGPTFRAEKSYTSRHLSEFWMMEPEMAFCDLDEMIILIEDFLKHLISYSIEQCEEEMAFFNQWIDKGRQKVLQSIVESDFAKITYTEAVDILKKSKRNFEFPVGWGLDLQSEHERFLSEEYFKKPVFVTDYPRDIKAFYMRVNEDEKTVRAVDVLVPLVGEIVGGSQREERYDYLRKNMVQQGMDIEEYQWFLDIRKYGTVPHSGFGLGFERMLMYLSGMTNIRDVMPFPRFPRSAKF